MRGREKIKERRDQNKNSDREKIKEKGTYYILNL